MGKFEKILHKATKAFGRDTSFYNDVSVLSQTHTESGSGGQSRKPLSWKG